MTDKAPIARADRERAASLEPNGKERDQILRGKRDREPLLQAFADHRIEGGKRLRATLAELRAIVDVAPELNMSNYCEEDVAAINEALIECSGVLDLAEDEPKR